MWGKMASCPTLAANRLRNCKPLRASFPCLTNHSQSGDEIRNQINGDTGRRFVAVVGGLETASFGGFASNFQRAAASDGVSGTWCGGRAHECHAGLRRLAFAGE